MMHLSFCSIRCALGITADAAARLLRVGPATYRRWELSDPAAPLEAWAAVATGTPCERMPASAIRAMRKTAGLTQAQAAALAGTGLLAWARWESGQTRAPAWRLVLFAARLPAPRAPTSAVEPPAPWTAPTPQQVRAARVAAGLTLRQAADLVYLPRVTDWEAAERHDMRAPLCRQVWALWLHKSAAPVAAPPGLPAPGALRAMRRTAGLTQAQAADLVYATRAAWEAWESGRNQIGRVAWELWLFKVSGR